MADASNDERSWRNELRSLVIGGNLVALVLCIALGTWGIFGSMADASGDSPVGSLAVAAPGVYAGWCMSEMAWRRGVSLVDLLLRLVSACLIAPFLVAVPVGVIQLITIAFPGVRAIIDEAAAGNGGFHYYWDEGIASQLFLVPLGGVVIGMCVALGAALIIVMPVLSIRAPQVVAGGSHLEKVDAGRRDSTTAFVFCGLGAIVLGIVLWVFGDGDSIAEAPAAFGRAFDELRRYGSVYWPDTVWLFGVVLVVLGVLFAGIACVRVIAARARARER